MDTTPENGSLRTVDTLIIGGGQAGLALGYYLAQRNSRFAILDAYQRIGDAWRQRWDSLRLFTPAKYDGLPGMPFPGDRLAFPTKDELADYLEAYAGRFDLPVVTGTRVDRLWAEDGHYLAASGSRRWQAANVVVATGGLQRPQLPPFAENLSTGTVQMHSSAYRSPAQLKPGRVLVVGLGNSGAEIALELSRTHQVLLSGVPSAELPVRHGRTAARFVLPVVRFLALHVLTLDTPIGRRVAPAFTAHAAPLIRTKRRDLSAAGVQQVPRITGVADGKPVTAAEAGNAGVLDVENVIWCTGYRDDFGWLDLPVFDDKGRPRQRRGIVESVPGLYFLGLEFMYAASSATLPGVGRDAKYLAAHLTDDRARRPADATVQVTQ